MKDKNKKLVLSKNTTKTLKTQTAVKAGTRDTGVYGRSSIAGSIVTGTGGTDPYAGGILISG